MCDRWVGGWVDGRRCVCVAYKTGFYGQFASWNIFSRFIKKSYDFLLFAFQLSAMIYY